MSARNTECPEFKGIKTWAINDGSAGDLNTECPEFKGIKTDSHEQVKEHLEIPNALNSKGLRLDAAAAAAAAAARKYRMPWIQRD